MINLFNFCVCIRQHFHNWVNSSKTVKVSIFITNLKDVKFGKCSDQCSVQSQIKTYFVLATKIWYQIWFESLMKNMEFRLIFLHDVQAYRKFERGRKKFPDSWWSSYLFEKIFTKTFFFANRGKQELQDIANSDGNNTAIHDGKYLLNSASLGDTKITTINNTKTFLELILMMYLHTTWH